MSLVKSAGDKSLEELANQIKNNTSMPITKESSVRDSEVRIRETAKAAEQNTPAEESEMHREKAVRVAKPCTGIRLCAPSAAHVIALRKTNGRYLPRAA